LLAQSVTPARVPAAPGGLAALAGLGVLTGEITPELVDEVIDLSGCREKRQRLLPARAVVYFVLGLCLFSGADSCVPPGYRSVMRWLTNSVRHLHGLALPTSSALTRARQRLGSKPLELLFDLRRGPLAGEGMPGAFAFGLRLVAWDGTGIDVADTPVNAREFGVTQGGNPQIRLLALIECGTRAVIDAAFDGVERASEHKLARRLLHALGPGMLLLADRNFAGYELWGLVTAAGADMAWRIKKNLVLPPVKVLDDGSFLSIMPTPAENVRFGQARARGKSRREFPHGHLIRVIEYTVTVTTSDGRTRTEPFRLATTLLNRKQTPARRSCSIPARPSSKSSKKNPGGTPNVRAIASTSFICELAACPFRSFQIVVYETRSPVVRPIRSATSALLQGRGRPDAVSMSHFTCRPRSAGPARPPDCPS
jgi:hypothetical protein